MPEGDSIRRLAARLRPRLVGERVRSLDAHDIADSVAETVVGHTVVATSTSPRRSSSRRSIPPRPSTGSPTDAPRPREARQRPPEGEPRRRAANHAKCARGAEILGLWASRAGLLPVRRDHRDDPSGSAARPLDVLLPWVPDDPMSRTDRFLDEIRVEFPSFRIRKKRESLLQRAIHVVLALLTLGGQRVYLTRYHTVLFGTLWVPDAWDAMSDADRYILLRHERVHLRQRKRMGDLVDDVRVPRAVLPALLRVGPRADRVGGLRRDHPRHRRGAGHRGGGEPARAHRASASRARSTAGCGPSRRP